MSMAETATAIITGELQLGEEIVKNTVALLDNGCTVPFIARYRKEMTGSLDETGIISIRDRISELRVLEKRKKSIIESLEKRGLVTDDLRKKLKDASSLPRLEDIYLPFRQNRKTRSSTAIEQGLEKLADLLLMQSDKNPEDLAFAFINPDLKVMTIQDALKGACHIISAKINENIKARSIIRKLFVQRGKVRSSVVSKEKDPTGKYMDYYDFQTLCRSCPSHRILALFRGEKEKVLSLKIQPDQEEAISKLEGLFLKGEASETDLVKSALIDGYKRLLAPSMETELRKAMKKNADLGSIKVFSNNLYHLLMESPLGRKNMIAIDPGFRTGCKTVCLDREGRLVHSETIYPVPPKNLKEEATERIRDLINRYSIEAIAIGNGTGGRETELFIRSLNLKDVMVTMVNESGASVYSASSAAREEFPDHDITVRGAVSIGRRLMDPLSELVKIEPKSIGVGQYQHDVDQKLLNKSLEDVIVSCVNKVGVDLNTASRHLLSYVSGIGASLAAKIFSYRTENGPFRVRQELLEVSGLGPSIFQQCAGFLRILDSRHPLDATAVHPDNYHIVEKMATDMGYTIEDVLEKPESVKSIDINNYIDDKTGLPTLRDIISELLKPGRDPRREFNLFEYSDAVNSIEDLKEGMVLPGIVTNVTDFGAFVDIGVHQDGLVHISRMSKKFVKNPGEIAAPGMKVRVKVDNIDITRKRISLVMDDIK